MGLVKSAWVSSSSVGLEISDDVYLKWVIKILVFTASFRTVRCRRRRHRVSAVLSSTSFNKSSFRKCQQHVVLFLLFNVTSRDAYTVQGRPSSSLVPELHARNHNQQYTHKLNIQQHSIYKITTVNIHKQSSFPQWDSNPIAPAVHSTMNVKYVTTRPSSCLLYTSDAADE